MLVAQLRRAATAARRAHAAMQPALHVRAPVCVHRTFSAAPPPAADKATAAVDSAAAEPVPAFVHVPACDPLGFKPAALEQAPAETAAPAAEAAAAAGEPAVSAPAPDKRAAAPQSLWKVYAQLSKARLSSLVVLTSGAGFLMAGAPASWPALAAATIGTSLAAAAAGTFNQVWEIRTDALMKRTQTRPLPIGRVTAGHALTYGGLTAAVSGLTLLLGANPLTAALGVGNIALYSLIYTPMKVRSTWNTAVGALVGAVPPLMGWAAATGGLLAWEPIMMGLTLFWWQFPHFYSLGWTLRRDYARGGYCMVPVFDPAGNVTAALSLRSAVAMSAIPLASSILGITSPMFAVEGVALNAYFLTLCARFYRNPSDATARAVFRASLWYLPVLLFFMVFHSKHWKKDAGTGTDSSTQEALEGGDQAKAAQATAAVPADGAAPTAAAAVAPSTNGNSGGVVVSALNVVSAAAGRSGQEKHHLNVGDPSQLLQLLSDQLHAWGRALCVHEVLIHSTLLHKEPAAATPAAPEEGHDWYRKVIHAVCHLGGLLKSGAGSYAVQRNAKAAGGADSAVAVAGATAATCPVVSAGPTAAAMSSSMPPVDAAAAVTTPPPPAASGSSPASA